MKLSVETGATRKDVPLDVAIRRIAAAGFDAVDFSFNTLDMTNESILDEVRSAAALIKECGMTVVQAHAPFAMKESNRFDEEDPVYCALVRSMVGAGIVGAPAIVVHAIKPTDMSAFYDLNRAYYLSLEPYARRAGVRIAVENLYYRDENGHISSGILSDPREHCKFVESLGSDTFTICLDLGHSAIDGVDPAYSIRTIGKERLGYMHVHDNDGVDDLHMVPSTGRLKWRQITDALREIGYEGNISFELIGCMRRAEPEFASDILAFAERVGRHLIAMVKGEE